MNKTIYISGSITDPATGQPRDGWQKDFLEAEARLKDMGFEVINPVELAVKADGDWADYTAIVKARTGDHWPMWPTKPPRWFYLARCLQRINGEFFTLHVDINTTPNHNLFAGIYVIGSPEQIQRSYGTMCEINFVLSASLPVWSQYYHGYQMDNQLRQITDLPTLAEAARDNDNKQPQ